MVIQLLLLAFGLVLLIGGAELLVRGARQIALKLGIPTLIVGLTVVAFGTSAPELFVSTAAALEGNGDIAIGNIIGSNICNILLIVGLTACLSPVVIPPSLNWREMPAMIASLVLFYVFSYDLVLGRMEGACLFFGLLLYLYGNYRVVKSGERTLQAEVLEEEAEEGLSQQSTETWVNIVLILLGLVGLVVGADFIVDNAVLIAKQMGISDLVIGVTLVAIGTSLPELATTIVAAMKNEAELAVGNAVGSNIFNVLCVIGLTAIIVPLGIDPGALHFDMIVMILCSLLIWPVMIWRGVIGKGVGVLMLVAYVGYIAITVL